MYPISTPQTRKNDSPTWAYLYGNFLACLIVAHQLRNRHSDARARIITSIFLHPWTQPLYTSSISSLTAVFEIVGWNVCLCLSDGWMKTWKLTKTTVGKEENAASTFSSSKTGFIITLNPKHHGLKHFHLPPPPHSLSHSAYTTHIPSSQRAHKMHIHHYSRYFLPRQQ